MTTLDHVIATQQSEWVSFNEDPLFPVPPEGKECFHFPSEKIAKELHRLLGLPLDYWYGIFIWKKELVCCFREMQVLLLRNLEGGISGSLGPQTRAWKHQKYWLLFPKEHELDIYSVLYSQPFWLFLPAAIWMSSVFKV